MLSKPNLLVCTDFSTYSNGALKIAEKIRQKTNGHMDVLHVSEHTAMWDWLPNEGLPNITDAKFEVDLLNTLRITLSRQMENYAVTGEAHVSMGLPASVIIQEVIDKKIDLIVMGHKGQTGLNFPIGSLAQKIIASSPVPVLIIKQDSDINKIACLIDADYPMKTLINWSEEMSFLVSAHLTVVSVVSDIFARLAGYKKTENASELTVLRPEQKNQMITEVKDKIRSFLAKESRPELRVEMRTEKKLSFQLNSILTEEKIDLAMMKRHQHDFLEKILIGSETRRMLEIFKGNLLILPPSPN